MPHASENPLKHIFVTNSFFDTEAEGLIVSLVPKEGEWQEIAQFY